MGLGSSWTPSLHLRLRHTACRQLRTIACAVSPLCALPRRHWLAPTPRPRFWRSGDCLVLPYGPPATPWTASCRQFASFHAAKAAHRELLPRVLDGCRACGIVVASRVGQTQMKINDATRRSPLAAPSCSVLLRPAPSCSVLLRPAPSCSVLLRPAPSCSVLLRPAPSCSVLLRPAPSCSVLLRPAPSCSVLLRRKPSAR